MKSKLRIGVIGGGNMGSAIISGIRKKHSVCVCEKDASRRIFLKRTYRVEVTDLGTLMKRSKVIILAVKPQDFDITLHEMRPYMTRRHLVISIAAGITTKFIERQLGKVRVVRTMPNLPVKSHKGMTGIAKGKYAAHSDLRTASAIFKNVGEVLIVSSEDKLDAITAVSGSGPAYYFYFTEALMDSARKLGLSEEEALVAVNATLAGSSALLSDETGEDAASLRKKVTSKGGTTEAALKVLDLKDFRNIIADALRAAKKRAKELSK